MVARVDSLARVRTLSQRRTNDFPRVFALPVKFHTDFYGTIVEKRDYIVLDDERVDSFNRFDSF